MSWFKRSAQPTNAPAETACSFCRARRARVHHLIAGPGVSICNVCIGQSIVLIGDSDPRSWLDIVLEFIRGCCEADAARLAELLRRFACALANGDVHFTRAIADEFSARGDAAAFARAACAAYLEIDRLSLYDASHAVHAALLAGDLELATTIRPAADGDLERPDWMLTQHQVALMRTPAGSADIAARLEAVIAIRRGCDEGGPSDLLEFAGLTEAYARVRAGNHAIAARGYAAFTKASFAPWHVIALGDAHDALGHAAEARELWTRVADKPTQPYWSEQARERLARESTPYR